VVKLKIKVTKEVLKETWDCGLPGKSIIIWNCPIAVAVREIFPTAEVAGTYIVIRDTNDYWNKFNISLPKEAKDFVAKFDCTPHDARPQLNELEFEVEIPDALLETINIDEIKQILKTSKTLELKEV
jgi:hypothetical protein